MCAFDADYILFSYYTVRSMHTAYVWHINDRMIGTMLSEWGLDCVVIVIEILFLYVDSLSLRAPFMCGKAFIFGIVVVLHLEQ